MSAIPSSIIRKIAGLRHDCDYLNRLEELDCTQELLEDVTWLMEKWASLNAKMDQELADRASVELVP